MKRLIDKNLYIADGTENCHSKEDNQAIVHACKYPCHRDAVGYKKIDQTHPDYLYKETEKDLYLNMIDPQEPMFSVELFTKAKEFIKKHIDMHEVIVHCNAAQSRSPMIAMLYINKEKDYEKAKEVFKNSYWRFSPTLGIDTFVREHWEELR